MASTSARIYPDAAGQQLGVGGLELYLHLYLYLHLLGRYIEVVLIRFEQGSCFAQV